MQREPRTVPYARNWTGNYAAPPPDSNQTAGGSMMFKVHFTWINKNR